MNGDSISAHQMSQFICLNSFYIKKKWSRNKKLMTMLRNGRFECTQRRHAPLSMYTMQFQWIVWWSSEPWKHKRNCMSTELHYKLASFKYKCVQSYTYTRIVNSPFSKRTWPSALIEFRTFCFWQWQNIYTHRMWTTWLL